jgi:hypothetical protein
VRKAVAAFSLVGLLLGGVCPAQDSEQRYAIDAETSDLHWLVYKAGALARRGHNHTIAVQGLRGSVSMNRSDVSASRFELEFSVADLVVDDPALRSALGADFSSVPSEQDVAGTRTNMLSERVLDGAQFPQIRIVGTGPLAREGAQTLAVEVELLGRTVALTVPTEVTIDATQVRATGKFELDHAALGMQPFSVVMGALQVGETISFSYDVVARREVQ